MIYHQQEESTKMHETKDWFITNLTNIFGGAFLFVANNVGWAEIIEVVVTILGVAALAWYNVERALTERKKRRDA